MRLGVLGHSGRWRLSKSDLSLYDGFDSQDFYNWNTLVRSERFQRYKKEDAQGPLGLAKGYCIGFYRAVPVTPPEKTPKHGASKMKAAGIAAAGIVGAGAAYGMLSDSDGDGTPNYAEMFGKKPTMPAPYVIVDKDMDGLPDDLEEKWGYSTSEKDVRLKYWVQNPEENKALVDAALTKVVDDYREKNPLKVNIHTYYGGEIPADVSHQSDQYYKFEAFTRSEKDSFARFLIDEYQSPTGATYKGNLDEAFFVRGLYLNERVEGRAAEGALCGTHFNAFMKDYVGTLPAESLAINVEHELGHNMCLDHTSSNKSIMGHPNGGEDFLESEWTFLKTKRLLDFRANEVVSKYVPE